MKLVKVGGDVVNRLGGRRRGRHKDSFLGLGEDGSSELFMASRSGLRWRSYEDSAIIMAGMEEDPLIDEQLAAQLGRTPSAVRARRAKLKEMGKF